MADWTESALRRRLTRRLFLGGTAAVAARGLLVACGGADEDSPATTAPSASTPGGGGAATAPAEATSAGTETSGSPETGAGGTPTTGGSILIGTLGEAGTINPIAASQSEDYFRCSLIYEQLVRLDPATYEPKPSLASQWEVNDLTFTFTLHDNIMFSDGSNLTADDIAFTIQAMLDTKNASPRQSRLMSIEGAKEFADGSATEVSGVKVVDPTTIEITLAEPDASILFNMYYVRPLPKALLEGKDLSKASTDPFFQNPVGAGPFKFVSWTVGADFVGERNEHYYQEGKPYLDKFTHRTITDSQALVNSLLSGDIDGSVYPSPSGADQLKANADLEVLVPPFGSPDGWIFNFKNEYLAKKEVRQAIAYALDMEQFAKDSLYGLGAAGTGPVAPGNFVYDSSLTPHPYDMDKAKAAVDAAMEAEGFAKNADGKWERDGNVATVIVLIRTEDARLEIGNYFANQLEELGFVTDRQEKTRTDAGPIWQQTDPAECQFMVYTAGWISTAISRDDGAQFTQFNTGTMQNLPAMNEYQPSAELAAVQDRLFTNSFANMDERKELFEEALVLSMKESWWGIWLTDNTSFSPYSNKVVGAYDLAGGFASAELFPYTVRFEGQEGGELKIAQSGILVSPWNPVAGSNWTDDAGVQRFAMDWGTVYNPYTGLYMPKLVESAAITVEEGLPVGIQDGSWVTLETAASIPVPEDAWVDWDAANEKWITAAEKYPEGTTAKSKSVVVYRPELWDTTWHDGTPFTIADIVFNMIMQFDGGKPESSRFDESLVPGVETLLSHFKGVKITSTDPLTIETYDDTYALDAENNVTTWYPSRYIPAGSSNGMINLQSMVGAMLAEENGELALSPDK